MSRAERKRGRQRIGGRQQVELARQDENGRCDREDDDRDVGGLELRMQARELARDQLVRGERVAEPRDAYQSRVGGYDQDREGEDGDPDPGPEGEHLRPELGHDTGHWILCPFGPQLSEVHVVLGVELDGEDTHADGG